MGTRNIIMTLFKFFAIDISSVMMFDVLSAIAKGCEDGKRTIFFSNVL